MVPLSACSPVPGAQGFRRSPGEPAREERS